jgi:hypothetical protein
MADIIELEVVGKVTNLKPMLSTVARLERELVRATKALDQNKISQQRYNTIIASTKTQYAALGVSAQRANSQVDKMAMSLKNTQAAEKAAQATRNLAREKDMLARKYKPLYSAIQMYKKSLAEIKRANELGIISDKQRKASIMQLKAGFQQASTGMSSGVAQVSRSTNQLGVVAQQTGYQVGDFLVQIQSGANPMMAFGQQATQLVGVLPLLSAQLGVSASRLMGIAAGLGIAIPLVTAIAGYFLRSRDAANEAAKSQTSLEESVAATLTTVLDATQAFKDFNNNLGKGVGNGIRDIERATQAVEDLQEKIDTSIGLTGFSGIDIPVMIFQKTIRMNGLLDEQAAAVARLNKLKDANAERSVQLGQEAISLQDKELEIIFAKNAEGEDGVNVLRLTNELERLSYSINLKKKGIVGEEARLLELGLITMQSMTEELIEQNKIREDTATADEMLATLLAENELQQEINDHGKDSVEVAEMRAAQERKVYAALVEQLQVLPEMKSDIMDAYDASIDLAAGLDNVGDRARDAANGVMSILGALRATLRELDAQESGLAAAQKVIKSGGSEIDGKVIQAGIEFESSISAKGLDGPELQAAVAQEMANERRRLENQQLESTIYDVFNKSGSSGSKAAKASKEITKDKLDFVQALQAEMVIRERLNGLYGDEYKLQSEIARIVKGLGEDSGKYNEQAIKSLAQQNLLLIEQEALREESIKQTSRIYDLLENEMGTALTSMIDGTKSVEDAFKNMAKSIIDELIQIMVVEKMVNSIMGIFGGFGGFGMGSSSASAATNVISSVVPTINPHTRATGGPVNAGMPYIVGENEPELFVPNTSGNIYNQKQMANMSGNGGDNVVIHQSFNFSANGDDTVKRLIQQAAPQIAQMTKSSMLNDRRRGGQTKSVFG